jgi:protein-disulfide isomerase
MMQGGEINMPTGTCFAKSMSLTSKLHVRIVSVGPLLTNSFWNIEYVTDFECPFCGSFHKTLKAVREQYPTQVALTYVHFPLPMHRFALPAARVAECADDQVRFERLTDCT